MTRRNRQHGGVPWYLMFAIVTAIGVGFVVYRVMHKRGLAEAAERARAPKPLPKPVEVAPVPEPEPAPVPEEAPLPEDPQEAEVPPADGLAESLDRAMIAEGIAKVKGYIMQCAATTEATGRVKAKVKVEPDGHVSVVTVDAQSDPQLGTCVQKFVKLAVFAKTQTGGSFSYPFTF